VAVLPAHTQVACLALDGRLLAFGLDELKLQSNGGRGLTLMDVDAKVPLVSVASFADSVRVLGRAAAARPRKSCSRAWRWPKGMPASARARARRSKASSSPSAWCDGGRRPPVAAA
jgi:topoisomerase-4 subunit A